MTVFGLEIPDAGPVFFVALAAHVLAGMTCVVAGALAATARKRRGRHPTAGRVYLYGLGVVFTTATLMAVIRWREDAHLFAIATVAFGLGLLGRRARRLHRPGWPLVQRLVLKRPTPRRLVAAPPSRSLLLGPRSGPHLGPDRCP